MIPQLVEKSKKKATVLVADKKIQEAYDLLEHIGYYTYDCQLTQDSYELLVNEDYKSFIQTYGGAVILPAGITEIQANAFRGCDRLSDIIIPEGVIRIGVAAFSGCEALQNIVLPNSLVSIGDYAFFQCSRLNNITVPNSVTSIGEHAFAECQALESIIIPHSVEHIGNLAFAFCYKANAYCEAPSKPESWDENWNGPHIIVHWGYTE